MLVVLEPVVFGGAAGNTYAATPDYFYSSAETTSEELDLSITLSPVLFWVQLSLSASPLQLYCYYFFYYYYYY